LNFPLSPREKKTTEEGGKKIKRAERLHSLARTIKQKEKGKRPNCDSPAGIRDPNRQKKKKT